MDYETISLSYAGESYEARIIGKEYTPYGMIKITAQIDAETTPYVFYIRKSDYDVYIKKGTLNDGAATV